MLFSTFHDLKCSWSLVPTKFIAVLSYLSLHSQCLEHRSQSVSVLVRVLKKKRTTSLCVWLCMCAYVFVCICVCRDGWRGNLIFKKLAHKIMGDYKSVICRAVQQLWNWGKSWYSSLDSKIFRLETLQGFYVCLEADLLFLGKPPCLFLRPSIDEMRPTHIVKDNLLYLKYNDLKCNHLKSTFPVTPRQMFDQIAGHHSLSHLTYKSNHYNGYLFSYLISFFFNCCIN